MPPSLSQLNVTQSKIPDDVTALIYIYIYIYSSAAAIVLRRGPPPPPLPLNYAAAMRSA
jgi:hypothetical protein